MFVNDVLLMGLPFTAGRKLLMEADKPDAEDLANGRGV